MKILCTFCLLNLVLARITSAQPADFRKYYDLAQAAYKEKKYEQFYTHVVAAGRLHPYHQSIFYLRARGAALMGKKDEAIKYLKRALLINVEFPLKDVEDFSTLKDSKEFLDLLDLQEQLKKPVIHSDTAFVIKDRSLHTEGIEFDARRNLFYLGSIHKRKVVFVDASGVTQDFCPTQFEGMTSVFGLKADTKRNLLWVGTSPIEEMENFSAGGKSAVYKFDLTSRQLIGKFNPPEDFSNGVFGDLILSKDGDVYVSDSRNNAILKLNQQKNQLEVFYTSGDFWNIQGLAFSSNEKFLFISDYIKGIFRLNTSSRELALLPVSENFSQKGIDGLYFHDDYLLGIQNGVTPFRVVKFGLNSTLSSISRFEVLDWGHPAFHEPTLGVISGDTLYYIANSQWGGYDDQHRIKPDQELQDIVVLKVDLKERR